MGSSGPKGLEGQKRAKKGHFWAFLGSLGYPLGTENGAKIGFLGPFWGLSGALARAQERPPGTCGASRGLRRAPGGLRGVAEGEIRPRARGAKFPFFRARKSGIFPPCPEFSVAEGAVLRSSRISLRNGSCRKNALQNSRAGFSCRICAAKFARRIIHLLVVRPPPPPPPRRGSHVQPLPCRGLPHRPGSLPAARPSTARGPPGGTPSGASRPATPTFDYLTAPRPKSTQISLSGQPGPSRDPAGVQGGPPRQVP